MNYQYASFIYKCGELRSLLAIPELRGWLFAEYGGIIPSLDKNLKALDLIMRDKMFEEEKIKEDAVAAEEEGKK